MSKNKLTDGLDALRSGDKRTARRILGAIVRQDSDNLDAWWYLSEALDDPEQQLECLKQVLRLHPSHAEALKKRLELERRVARHTPAQGLQQPTVYDTRDQGEKLVVVAAAESTEEKSPDEPVKQSSSDVTVMTIAVLIALCAIIGTVALVWTGRTSDFWGLQGTEYEPTLQPLAFDVPACAATANNTTSLVFINNAGIPLDIYQGALGKEKFLITLSVDAQAPVEVEPDVTIRYAVETDTEGYVGSGATIAVPQGHTCRVPIQ